MRILLTFLLLAALLLTGTQAGAVQVGSGQVRLDSLPAAQAQQSNGLTLSQAVEQVRRQYKGRIVSAKTKVNGKGETHVIKVLTRDGKVKTVNVPGKRNG